jgi:hypothetical protein
MESRHEKEKSERGTDTIAARADISQPYDEAVMPPIGKAKLKKDIARMTRKEVNPSVGEKHLQALYPNDREPRY